MLLNRHLCFQNLNHPTIMKLRHFIAVLALSAFVAPLALAESACKKCCKDNCAACCKDKGKECGKDCCKKES